MMFDIKPTNYAHPGDEYECFTNTWPTVGVYLHDVDRRLQDKWHAADIARWTKGPPMATDHYTSQELAEQGMFGLYRRKDGSDWGGSSPKPVVAKE